MTTTTRSPLRNGHFLGAKLRALRKRNDLTLEELSARCVALDARAAPSVPYLSMIESGKRVPSEQVLALLARVFDRPLSWFLDENAELGIVQESGRASPVARMPLEPSFLFSKELLQAALPELLRQTGTTGRQFAHLLIRSRQEACRNEFPDLERAADAIGGRAFPLGVEDLMRLARRQGLVLRWFERKPVLARDKDGELRSLVRSFFEAPRTVYLNRALQHDPARLKFDLAAHIGHKVLHGGDGLKSAHATGGEIGGSPESGRSGELNAQDILHAWRDFECSFFAGALLCPRAPFRRFLARERYRIESSSKLELTPSVFMRRIPCVSPYPYWHFFDAYAPGYLRAVYRGNGIPLPWGSMSPVNDPCRHWAVFRMLQDDRAQSGSQISVMHDGERFLLYCCHSVRTRDMAGNPHVLSVGIDLAPALDANAFSSTEIIRSISDECMRHGGVAPIPGPAREALSVVANVLNIDWIHTALLQSARIICPRSSHCPRAERCEGARPSRAREITDVRREILGELRLRARA